MLSDKQKIYVPKFSAYTSAQYDEIINRARELMLAKNHDYGDSWRLMRASSITDQILVKIHYAVFEIIQLEEQQHVRE